MLKKPLFIKVFILTCLLTDCINTKGNLNYPLCFNSLIIFLAII